LSPNIKISTYVVDNGSTDKTKEIVSLFPVKILEVLPSNRSIARNHGAKVALEFSSNPEKEILVFLDADCRFSQNFIQNLIKDLANKNSAVQARLLPRNSTVALSHLGKQFIDSKAFCISAFLFNKLNGFNPKFSRCEDIDFGWRLVDLNNQIVISKLAVCHTLELKTFGSAINRGFETAKGLAQVHTAHNISKISALLGFIGISKREILRANKESRIFYSILRIIDNLVTFVMYFFFRLIN
jgi:cellulose synthase/poly-beta-1,6-N-acetylglucosamine synthase-like glycosyltransferase